MRVIIVGSGRVGAGMASQLAEEGHEVVTTPKPAEAESLLAERGFDVLVVDNRMPGKTGLEERGRMQEGMVADITIFFCSRFTSHPCSRKSTASQSRRSG